jgi:hypothetical protein
MESTQKLTGAYFLRTCQNPLTANEIAGCTTATASKIMITGGD